MEIRTKRAYDDPSPDDGTRVLVDRLWPRGVSKQEAALERWAKELAPSDELRRWFDHDPDRWEGFQERYREELSEHDDLLDELLDADDRLTLVYAAKDEEHNNAVVLAEVLRERAG